MDDPELAGRWSELGQLPEGTPRPGRLHSSTRPRGFVFPGLPGSAPPLLAQHDWVHVLADFGTTVESELEVFAFIARANDDMRAFSLLAMVISLFETGYLRTGAGLFEASPGHLSSHDGVAVRIADAMRRGALCRDSVLGVDSIDYLHLDWFTLAELPVDRGPAAVRRGGQVARGRRRRVGGPLGPGGHQPVPTGGGPGAGRPPGPALRRLRLASTAPPPGPRPCRAGDVYVLPMASPVEPPAAVLLDAGGVFVLPDPDRILGAFARAECSVGREVLADAHYRAAARFGTHLDVEANWAGAWLGYLQTYVAECGVPEAWREEAHAHIDSEFADAALWVDPVPGVP